MADPVAVNNNNNNARFVLRGQQQEPVDRHRLERQLRLHGIVYMMLGGSFLLRLAIPTAHEAVVVGFLLSMAAVALIVLSFHLRRFPLAARAAALLAQAALRAFFN